MAVDPLWSFAVVLSTLEVNTVGFPFFASQGGCPVSYILAHDLGAVPNFLYGGTYRRTTA